jgi:hypothetical protein
MRLKPVFNENEEFNCNDLYLMATGANSGYDIFTTSHYIAQMLIEKNIAYGDSALDPVRIFSKANNVEQLLVRIDDKLSRFARGTDYPGDNDIDDLIGYLVLLKIAKMRNDGKEKGNSGSGN